MHTVLVASNNAHKLQEMREIIALAGASDAIRLITPNDLGLSLNPDETADTYAGNALLKARAFANALHAPSPNPSPMGRENLLILADDSGLEVDALGGRPGVDTAPYARASPGGDGPAALLREMGDVPNSQRTARFRCIIALITPAGEEHLFEGSCEGHIGGEKRGLNGFGFDPVFVVAGDARRRAMAELSSEEKHRISHRGVAMRKAAEFLLRHTL
jgi:XTP/dITP diphosphohydrolase